MAHGECIVSDTLPLADRAFLHKQQADHAGKYHRAFDIGVDIGLFALTPSANCHGIYRFVGVVYFGNYSHCRIVRANPYASYSWDTSTSSGCDMTNDPQQKSNEYWKNKLTDDQYNICRMGGTEPPFSGAYWDNHKTGMYHCVACGQPLFSSDTKFESGTGWPSFYKAVDDGKLELEKDQSHGMVRTEVRCGNCGSHLGHLFDDGPKTLPDGRQATGKRYCINSAALKFKPTE